jgi:serine/threonine protein kinase/WD40 repeat protein
VKTVNVIEAVFFAALDKKNARERAAYLDQACVGDPDLRRCVEKLLAAQPKVGEFLQAPAPGLPAADAKGATVDHAPDERPGTILGPYKLLHEIGEGGMGTVWMAEQTEPVRRRVALKVIKPGMDSRQVLARFEAERQALALMDHPNIAKVLDAGATENGRPYFVMELVKGQPITEFSDKNRLTTRERLDLFVSVCNAIQHAHQKGVIHRDVKPSNVLVALYDGKPVPKVIDFGVAKAIGDPLTDKTLFTRHGQVVGTFEYMSPEQANLDQLDIDTRSDVYALGVLLYELLTGTTPLDKDRLRQAGLAEVLRLIREEEPPKPSTRLTSTPGLLATAAAYRKTDSQKLPRAVRGELDWIVMKALDKDRNRRFPTGNGLAADVERFLNGEPVQACPPTLSYRFRKYARKHKVALAAGGAIAAALLVGISLTSWQAVRAAAALGEARRNGQELDARLVDLQAANEKIGRAQEDMRVNRYAADMQALPLTWEAGNTFEARQLLEQQDADLRGFEWHYWNRQMHSEVASGTLPGLPEGRLSRAGFSLFTPAGFTGRNDWMFSDDGSRIACLTFSEDSTKPHERTLYVWDAATRKLLLPHPIAVEGLPAAADLRVSGDFSMSRDGKRAAVTVACYPRMEREGPGGPQGAVSAYPGSEKDRWVIHVIAVDRKKVIFKAGKKEDGEWTYPSVRLSRDGRRLLNDTARVGGAAGTNRITVWDLDSPDKEPVIIDNTTRCLFSPDGSRVVSYGEGIAERSLVLKAWDAATGKEIPDFVPGGVFSPKGTYLARVVPEGEGDSKTLTLKLHDGTTGKEISSTPLPGALVGQTPRGDVTALFKIIFSPDESLVAVPHRSTSSTPRMDWYIVETKTGHLRLTLEDPASNGGRLIGTPGLDRGARYFSDDGTQFICVVDNAIHTLPVAPGRSSGRTFRGHLGRIVAAAVSPNQRFRTVEFNGTLKEWDLTRKLPPPIDRVEMDKLAGGVFQFNARIGYSVSPGGGYVARLDREPGDKPDTVRVWDLARNRTTTFDAGPFKGSGFPGSSQRLFVSADGKRVALFRYDPQSWAVGMVDPQNPSLPSDVTVWEWDPATETNKQLLHREFPGADANRDVVQMWEFSKDGATIVLGRYDKVGTLPDGRVRYRVTLWTINVDTGREGPAIPIDGRLTDHDCLSPDGTRFASFVRTPAADGSWNDQFTVWDLVRGAQVCAGAPIRTITSNPFPRAFEVAPGPAAALWSPDGSRVAVSNGPGAYNSITLYDAATGKLVRTLSTSTRSSIAPNNPTITFSPDGRRIACEVQQRSGGSAISVLDTESGKEMLSLTPPRAFAGGMTPPGFVGGSLAGREVSGARLTFSPDGNRLLLFRRISTGAGIEGTRRPATALRVLTWDATPRPEPKQP